MPQSHAQIWLHIVFSTKNRAAWFQKVEFRDQMFRMLAHHARETGCSVAIIGGHVDHVHLLVRLSRTIAVSKLVEVVKTETSKWAKRVDGGVEGFVWQAGYGAFSVSYSNLGAVESYIRNQEQHHAGRSFKDEYRLLCEKHGVDIDERYVWD